MSDADPFEQLLREALAPTYLLVRKLGAGGMGSVYLARDPTLKRNVAVKVLSPELADDPGPRARFQREAEAVASLSHPNVVAVYSVGQLANGVPYFVMQHVNGRSFADRIGETGPLDVDSARRYLGDVASALAAAHKQRIIHRDIKPANILHDDESNRALVTDFGIASVLAAGAEEPPLDPARYDVATAVMSRLTQTGAMVGTPAYMSPEQLLAEPVTSKTDVYSLGLLGYEFLTGEGPYAISSPGEIIAAHVRAAPRPLVSVRPDVDPEFETLMHACLSKNPDERPTAEDVSRRLSRGADVLLEWPPPALERVHGLLRGALVPMGLGALLITVPLTIMTLDVDHRMRQALPPVATVAFISALGVAVLALGISRFVRLVRAAVPAVQAGHGWLTVAEVAADHRRDGGALIAGAREYATLLPAVRGAFRRRRVVAGVLSLTAAAAPVLGFIGAQWIGDQNAGTVALIGGTVILPAVLWALALNIEARDAVSLRAARKRLAREAPRAAASDLVTVWRSTFEEARRGQAGGTGAARKPRWLLVAGIALSVATLGAAVTTFALGIAGVASARRYSGLLVDDLENAQRAYEANRRLLAYRSPIDTTISPLRAGEAWHALAVYWGRDRSWRDEWGLHPLHRPPQRQIDGDGRRPPRTDDPVMRRLFRAVSFDGVSTGDWLTAALRIAPSGFTDRQRAALREAASTSAPTAREFAVLAQARATDFWAAALKEIPNGSDLMTTNWGMADRVMAAYTGHLAVAALDIEAGRTAEAEARIRRVIGVGLALNEDRAHTNLSGRGFAIAGARALREFYAATGQSGRLLSLDDIRLPSYTDSRFADAEEAAWRIRERVIDSATAPNVRWSALLFVIPYLPCLELRQLFFGPGADAEVFWTQARASLVQDSLDARLFRHAEETLRHPIAMRSDAPETERLQRLVLRFLDRVVGGHRFEACGAHRQII